ncbi:MAG: hypothetical protein WC806_03795 [Candidatus Gracilibacteria bacterium]|jgi:hypothetical protein
MNTIKRYLSLIVLFLIIVFVSFIVGYYYPNFLKSATFGSFITLVVGLFAIGLYIKKKEDFRSDAAGTLLMEIRYAERVIGEMRKKLSNFDTWVTILPSNNWSKYNYLFTDELDQDEMDLINNFYNDCLIIEKGVSLLDISTQLNQKGNHIQAVLATLAKDSSSSEQYNEGKKKFLEIFEKEDKTFQPKLPQERIVSVLNQIKEITTSTAGAKLKKVANKSKGY